MVLQSITTILQLVAITVLLVVPRVASDDAVQLSESFGGPHGNDFSDQAAVVSGQTVTSVTIRAGDRVDGVSLVISGPTAQTFTHGGTGGTDNTLTLAAGEHITSMEAHWDKKDDHTRVFYLSFSTSAGNTVSGGTQTDSTGSATAPAGYQLGGFFGRDGDEIDLLGAIWSSVTAADTAPGTVAPPDIPDTSTTAPVAQATTEPSTPGPISQTSLDPTSSGSAAVAPPASSAGSGSAVPVPSGSATSGSLEVSASPTPAPAPKASGPAVQLSETFGGPHGNEFSDQAAAVSGQTITSLTVRGAARIDGFTLEVSAPTAQTFTHGGTGGDPYTLKLGAGEYITSMEVHWGQKEGHTRVFYLNFGTSAGNSVSAGTQTDEKGSVTAPDGYQLGGFFGRDGDEIDLLGVVWTSIAVVDDTATTAGSGSTAAAVTDEDIVLSALYGGPHGNAFSDIDSIKFTQTVSSITLRSDKRVDAITLQITTPAEVTMNHGGTGGSDKTLTLGPGEYITSMEAHWGKKDDHTRVFYLKFTTSAGNSIEGGTTTDDNAVAKAPDGFQLAGFYGRAEDEVDQIGAIWTRISAKDLSLTDEEESSGSGVLFGTTIRNWVGPTIGQHSDTACYRKSVDFDSNNICPLGYGKEDTNCQAQCPLSYPIQCSLECIPQNDDCVLEALSKIGSVVAVALNAATGGVFGDILAAYKTAKWAVTCAANVVNVVRGLIYYLRYRQTTAPQGDTAELLTAAYQTDVVVYDLPVAVCACLGLPVPKNAKFADMVLVIVEGIVKQAITNGDEIISTGENVLKLLTGTGALNGTDMTTVDDLQDLINTNSSCGYELKRLTDHVIRQVNDVRNSTPDASPNDVRVKVYKSSIVMNDIPAVTNLCMGELLGNKTITAAFETRDMLRKTFGVIVDQLIDTGTTDMGKDVAKDDYMLKVANMGLVVLSTIDPTGIAYMASQFVQPICGPTAYLGEIDDGRLSDALGLTTVDEAFVGSYGTWTKKGDGVVHLILESVDIYDVKVVVHSGGDKYAEVKVGAGETVTWDATIPELQDKTLYLDRWRPGILGLPGSGGGSLLLWVPRSSEGGHLEMHVRINPS
ncbi:hypothetical protein F443_07777 [Phytophthora nicotianae P1569]|uniref:Jacalin-type lectin domain-containing protein n=1 Tax=Phytophthora nicotianae P1569 TaxID=1317065 RepID=V9FCM5_PHYNI|nr:hypothetical protein F443_07777 [Phytophthora nicotianae P1569]